MPDSTVTFAAHRRPSLAAGDYTITVSHQVTAGGTTDSFSTVRKFSVGGDRFALPPNAIRSVFPPEGSLGDHANVLPHVVLDRPSLPWERDPGGGGDNQPPWLALLLFDEGEQPQPRTTTLGALAGEGTVPAAATSREKHDSADDPVTVIDVPTDLLTDLVPPYPQLRLLAHVRGGTGPTADPDAAVVVGSRLPAAGTTSTVHLVSLEQRFTVDGSGNSHLDLPHPGRGATTVATVPVISLASWRFACVSADHSFPALVRDLAADDGELRLPGVGQPTTDRYLGRGLVPLRHRLRQGGRSIGWYRGPLTVGAVDGGPVEPVRTADALLRLHPDVGMFDVSYAAAWQLGRLLALRSTDISSSLFTWRRRRDADAKQTVSEGYPLAVPTVDTTMPEGLLGWLRGLARLEGVPFGYLLPDERLLPVESVRFVGLDQRWVRHLLDGATSIGRLGPADARRDAADPLPLEFPTVTGALIRSAVVPGYPGLLVDGYADAAGTQPLAPWRTARLAPDILLCLFSGDLPLGRLDLHQPPEGQHLAVERLGDSTFGKTLRAPGGTTGTPASVGPMPLGDRRTVPLTALGTAIAGALGLAPADLDSGDLALQLTETAERVTFLRG
ncbi:hypothetical protein ACI2K4_28710 [Micromonospora sp. NPDC050397]|uniref:hypothetical protein n=1 Tax=Micromonospora sp. NPDC050397 TaxID=3364279 RepID=UPI0038515227